VPHQKKYKCKLAWRALSKETHGHFIDKFAALNATSALLHYIQLCCQCQHMWQKYTNPALLLISLETKLSKNCSSQYWPLSPTVTTVE